MTRLAVLLISALGGVLITRAGLLYRGEDPMAETIVFLIGAGLALGATELFRRAQHIQRLSGALAELPPDATHERLKATPAPLPDWFTALLVGQPLPAGPVAFAPYLAGLLVLLGILGTFLGLTETLTGARAIMTANPDVETIRAGLAGPFSGLTRAFGTSVAGVAGSASLGLALVFVRRAETKLRRGVARYVTRSLSAQSLSGRQLAMLEAVEQRLAALPDTASALEQGAARLTGLSERLTELQAQSAAQAQAAQAQASERLLLALGEVSERQLKAQSEALATLNERLLTQSERHTAQLSEQVQRAGDHLSARFVELIAEATRGAAEAAKRELNQVADALAHHAQGREHAEQRHLQAIAAEVSRALSGWQAQQDAAATALSAHLTELAHQAEGSVLQVTEAASTQHTKLLALLGAHSAEMVAQERARADDWQAHLLTLAADARALAQGEADGQAARLNAFGESLQALQATLAEERAQHLEEKRQALAALTAAHDEALSRAEQALSAAALGAAAATEKALDALHTAAASAESREQARLEKLAQSLSHLEATLSETHSEALSRAEQALSAAAQGAAAATEKALDALHTAAASAEAREQARLDKLAQALSHLEATLSETHSEALSRAEQALSAAAQGAAAATAKALDLAQHAADHLDEALAERLAAFEEALGITQATTREGLATLTAGVADIQETLSEGTARQLAALDAHRRQAESTAATLGAELAEALRRVRAAETDANRRDAEVAEQLAQASERALARMEAAAQRSAADALALGQRAGELLTHLDASLAEHLSSLGAALSERLAGVLEMARTVPELAANLVSETQEKLAAQATRDEARDQRLDALLAQLGLTSLEVLDAAKTQALSLEALGGALTERLAAGEQAAHARQAEALTRVEAALTAQAGRLTEFEGQLSTERQLAALELTEVLREHATGLTDPLASAARTLKGATELLSAGGAELSAVAEMFAAAVDAHREAGERWLSALAEVEGTLAHGGGGDGGRVMGDFADQLRDVFADSMRFQQELFAELRALRKELSHG